MKKFNLNIKVTLCDLQWPFRSFIILLKNYVFVILSYNQRFYKIRLKAEKYITISKMLYIKWPYMTSNDVWGQALDHYEKFAPS